MLIDLHAHTCPASDDSFASADELIEAARALGLDGLCLTEHDRFWPHGEAAALARRHNFLVLPGCEINTDGGHVLAFGLRRYVFGMHHPKTLRHLADQEEAALVAAHPYRRRWLAEPGQDPAQRAAMLERAAQDPFFSLCHAIEGCNGRGGAEENRFSQDLAARLAIPQTGGSDAHRVGQLGTAATRFQRRVSSLAELIAELRAGRCAAEWLIAD